tara:strand:- start:20101 stop:20337 length:237 start_codon:yes stop_codon:yes gene_type:complete
MSEERFCSGEDETLEEAADKEGGRRSGVSTVLLAILHLASPHFQRRSACRTNKSNFTVVASLDNCVPSTFNAANSLHA